MISNLEKFVNDLCKGKHEVKGHLYSQILKCARLRLHMTLEEMARGICSISFLSKMENQVIIPDEEYVKALFERVHIAYENLKKISFVDELKATLEAYLRLDYAEVEAIFNRTNIDEKNGNALLIECIYLLINNREKDFKEQIGILDAIKNSLDTFQSLVLIYVVGEYYLKTNQYPNAYKYIKCLELIKTTEKTLEILIAEQNLKVSYYQKDYPRYFVANKYFENMDYFGYPYERKLIIDLIMCDFKASSFPDESKEIARRITPSSFNTKNINEVLYHKYNILIKTGELEEVYLEIMDNFLYKESNEFLALLGYPVYKTRNKVRTEEFLNIVNEVNLDEENVHTKFLRFLKMKFEKEKSYELVEFIKYDVIPFSKKYFHPLYNRIYANEFVNNLCKLSRYKEATLFLLNK